jgi:hypothetical protein
MDTAIPSIVSISEYFWVGVEESLYDLHISTVSCQNEGRRHFIVLVAFGSAHLLTE